MVYSKKLQNYIINESSSSHIKKKKKKKKKKIQDLAKIGSVGLVETQHFFFLA